MGQRIRRRNSDSEFCKDDSKDAGLNGPRTIRAGALQNTPLILQNERFAVAVGFLSLVFAIGLAAWSCGNLQKRADDSGNSGNEEHLGIQPLELTIYHVNCDL